MKNAIKHELVRGQVRRRYLEAGFQHATRIYCEVLPPHTVETGIFILEYKLVTLTLNPPIWFSQLVESKNMFSRCDSSTSPAHARIISDKKCVAPLTKGNASPAG